MTPKKRLLFLICALLDGGIDTILVEYLRNIDLGKFDVTLAIGIKMDEFEVHLPKIPHGVRIEYLVDAPRLTRWRKAKHTRRLPAAIKLYDEIILNPLRKLTSSRRLQRLLASHDAVIDFDATFYTALRRYPVPVVGFYHFSIAENLARNRRHTMRQMHGMAHYTAIALICDAMIDEGRRLFPELSHKFTRIYNGYNLRRRAAAPLPAALIPPPQGYFLSVARLEESQKDITTLLKAYALMRSLSAAPHTLPHLWLLGTGRDRSRLETLAGSHPPLRHIPRLPPRCRALHVTKPRPGPLIKIRRFRPCNSRSPYSRTPDNLVRLPNRPCRNPRPRQSRHPRAARQRRRHGPCHAPHSHRPGTARQPLRSHPEPLPDLRHKHIHLLTLLDQPR